MHLDFLLTFVQGMTYVLAVAEMLSLIMMIAHECMGPTSLVSTLDRLRFTTKTRITPAFLGGAMLVIAGALIRIACFKYLGRHFTFELSLRDKHMLITDGPYAIVRHPSYTGNTMMVIGLALGLLGHGSWAAGVGLWNTWFGKVFWCSGLPILRSSRSR